MLAFLSIFMNVLLGRQTGPHSQKLKKISSSLIDERKRHQEHLNLASPTKLALIILASLHDRATMYAPDHKNGSFLQSVFSACACINFNTILSTQYCDLSEFYLGGGGVAPGESTMLNPMCWLLPLKIISRKWLYMKVKQQIYNLHISIGF